MAANLDQPEPFVDANTVAQFLAITRRQVLEMARGGKIPAHPLIGSRRRVWRFKLSEVDAAFSGPRPHSAPDDDGALAEESSQRKMRSGSPRSPWRKFNG